MAWGPHVSATGLPSQHVDPVNRSKSTGQQGALGPPVSGPGGGTRGARSAGAVPATGDQKHGAGLSEFAGNCT